MRIQFCSERGGALGPERQADEDAEQLASHVRALSRMGLRPDFASRARGRSPGVPGQERTGPMVRAECPVRAGSPCHMAHGTAASHPAIAGRLRRRLHTRPALVF